MWCLEPSLKSRSKSWLPRTNTRKTLNTAGFWLRCGRAIRRGCTSVHGPDDHNVDHSQTETVTSRGLRIAERLGKSRPTQTTKDDRLRHLVSWFQCSVACSCSCLASPGCVIGSRPLQPLPG